MEKNKSHFVVLDGWRGIAILLVLGAHLLPLGPKLLRLNECFGVMGMAVFFTLSGFLITKNLIEKPFVGDFIIRRFSRIIPLAWLYTLIALFFISVNLKSYLVHFLFYGNLLPHGLTNITAHFWSLCVEMQFYVFIAFICLLFKEKGLKVLIPICCIAVTIGRIITGTEVSIVTYFRVDEILAGGILALIYKNKFGEEIKIIFKKTNLYVILTIFILSCSFYFSVLNYIRPYLALILVGITLFAEKEKYKIENSILSNKYLSYIATISYALYILHPLLAHTWLGEGDKIIKYLKRPLLFLILFLLAHISTFYYEKYWINFGKALTKKSKKELCKEI